MVKKEFKDYSINDFMREWVPCILYFSLCIGTRSLMRGMLKSILMGLRLATLGLHGLGAFYEILKVWSNGLKVGQSREETPFMLN